jgi:Icc-related predicted phosphoesterase
MATKKFTRLFFATDVLGSERCFRKFLSGARVYKADALILGGDITGKIVIPIISSKNGIFRADYLGREKVARTPDELTTERRSWNCAKSSRGSSHKSSRSWIRE